MADAHRVSARHTSLPSPRFRMLMFHNSNVQVTLQILAALIEKSPKDMPLFAPYVLKILDLVLRSDDLTMVESSLPTFATFCQNHDASSLQADQAYLQQYESVVRAYATLASTRRSPGKMKPTKPVAMRWRNTGLDAIRSLASSDAISSVSALRLDLLVPMILENLWTDNEDFLDVLQQRAQSDEKVDQDRLLKRRNSVATVRTVETAGDTNPIALLGSAVDVDKLAEEDIGVLAIQCLKQVFVVPNRPQIFGATTALLKFIEERVAQEEVVVKRHPHTHKFNGWAIKVMSLVTRWSPVQDRYVILVTIMDTMARMTMSDDTLGKHLVLAAIARSLLNSDINLIGLSVMDVLLGFVAQMKKTVHLPAVRPDPSNDSVDENERSPSSLEASTTATSNRTELLDRLQECIGDLATHVYYIDQISDMISTILACIRPRRASSTNNSSPSGERVEGQQSTASTTNLADPQQLETYFSLNMGKIYALRAIKSILLVANPITKVGGSVSLLRNRVPISVWEGTEGMLRDPDGYVRKAYVDVLVTWLDRETTASDSNARDEGFLNKSTHLKNGKDLAPPVVSHRAASSASAREKMPKSSRCHFLQLIHVAIYDNTLQFLDFEGDILFLHLLLTKLTMRFGVNAVRHSLPMIFRLQEDIQEAETPAAKVRIGSLCHGFFWTLTERFDFETTIVGRAIHNEVVRRRSKGFWVDGVHVPPPPVERLITPGVLRPPPKMPLSEIASEALLPFDDRISLVDCIAVGYRERTISPPASPAGSPGRQLVHPINAKLNSIPAMDPSQELPTRMREDMVAFEWSRERVIMLIQEGSKTTSLNGSRSGTTGFTSRGLLPVNGGAASGHSPNGPPSPAHSATNILTSRQNGMVGNRLRNVSLQSAISASPGSISSHGFVATVEQLKLVLVGGQMPRHTLPSGVPAEDTGSESMASCEFTPSELSFNPPQTAEPSDASPGSLVRSNTGSTRKASLGESLVPVNPNPAKEPSLLTHSGDDGNIPPVPPLSNSLTSPKRQAPASAPSVNSARDHSFTPLRSFKSREGDSSAPQATAPSDSVPAMDLQALLQGIDIHTRQSTLSSVTKPPY